MRCQRCRAIFHRWMNYSDIYSDFRLSRCMDNVCSVNTDEIVANGTNAVPQSTIKNSFKCTYRLYVFIRSTLWNTPYLTYTCSRLVTLHCYTRYNTSLLYETGLHLNTNPSKSKGRSSFNIFGVKDLLILEVKSKSVSST